MRSDTARRARGQQAEASWVGREGPAAQPKRLPPGVAPRGKRGGWRWAGGQTHLPLQERCDQAEVLGVLHESAGREGRA